jgi:hypothetical protein
MEANLHDALFHSVKVETLETTTFTIELSYLPGEKSRERTAATVTISNVASMSSTIDFARQAIHAVFGNVSDWKPAKRRGMSFFHLAGGTISVYGDVPVFDAKITDLG